MEIMKLVAAGKLNLEECFVDLPPDLSIDDKRCEGVKLYNMFIHTSGYGWFMRDKMADMFLKLFVGLFIYLIKKGIYLRMLHI